MGNSIDLRAIRIFMYLLLITLCFMTYHPPVAMSQLLSQSVVQNQEITDNLQSPEAAEIQNIFIYKRYGRPDPFFPFLTHELRQVEIDMQEELTGMRRFEPGQLTLVAIVFAGDQPLAMVQDAAGKGYVLRKGTKLGRSGEVVDISRNKVIIRQEVYALLTREKRYETVEMILKKEGEV